MLGDRSPVGAVSSRGQALSELGVLSDLLREVDFAVLALAEMAFHVNEELTHLFHLSGAGFTVGRLAVMSTLLGGAAHLLFNNKL